MTGVLARAWLLLVVAASFIVAFRPNLAVVSSRLRAMIGALIRQLGGL